MGREGHVSAGRAGRTLVAAIAAVIVSGLIASGSISGADEDKVPVEWFVGLGASEPLAKERTKAINGVAKAFERRNRGIDLAANIEKGDVQLALDGLVASGDVPDVIGPVSLRAFSAFSDSFADLTPLIDAAGFDLGAYPEGLLDAYRNADGALIGLPFGAFPSVTYYNRALFDEAGLAYPPRAVGEPYVHARRHRGGVGLRHGGGDRQAAHGRRRGPRRDEPDFDPSRIVQFGSSTSSPTSAEPPRSSEGRARSSDRTPRARPSSRSRTAGATPWAGCTRRRGTATSCRPPRISTASSSPTTRSGLATSRWRSLRSGTRAASSTRKAPA